VEAWLRVHEIGPGRCTCGMEWVITVKLPALTIAATDLLGERGRTGSASERPHPAHWVRPSLLAGQSNSPARRLVPGDPHGRGITRPISMRFRRAPQIHGQPRCGMRSQGTLEWPAGSTAGRPDRW
jgi:hypothetical protein